MALVMFTLTAYCVGLARDGYRSGKMPVFFGHVWSLVFDRANAPALFWCAAVFNLSLIAVFAACGVILLIGVVVHP